MTEDRLRVRLPLATASLVVSKLRVLSDPGFRCTRELAVYTKASKRKKASVIGCMCAKK